MSEECPVSITLNTLNGKWKLLIIKEFLAGKKRFSELKKAMPEVTQKMLTKQLILKWSTLSHLLEKV